MTQEPQKNVVLIVIAIIGVVGTIVASGIGAFVNYNIEKERQGFELTRIALVSIVTQGGATQVSMASTISAPTDLPFPIYSPSPVVIATATDKALTQCEWLKNNLPQTQQDVIAHFGFPADTKINFIYELCPSTANAFGLEATTDIQLDVPSGGCIDSWAGFTKYTGDVGTPVPDGWGGWRVYKGTVRAPGMTYRIMGCK
jgi:type II secretory pathway pseudopilin PulG